MSTPPVRASASFLITKSKEATESKQKRFGQKIDKSRNRWKCPKRLLSIEPHYSKVANTHSAKLIPNPTVTDSQFKV
jgi:hypothetical protein